MNFRMNENVEWEYLNPFNRYGKMNSISTNSLRCFVRILYSKVQLSCIVCLQLNEMLAGLISVCICRNVSAFLDNAKIRWFDACSDSTFLLNAVPNCISLSGSHLDFCKPKCVVEGWDCSLDCNLDISVHASCTKDFQLCQIDAGLFHSKNCQTVCSLTTGAIIGIIVVFVVLFVIVPIVLCCVCCCTCSSCCKRSEQPSTGPIIIHGMTTPGYAQGYSYGYGTPGPSAGYGSHGRGELDSFGPA
jgi:hypothetical protein